MGKHFTTLNISYEPGPTEQLENNEDGAPAETLEPPNAGRGFVRGLAEFFDPFEALGTVFEEPRLVLAFLVVLAAGGLIVLIACGLWEAVQEAFLGGGPPQGLGLK